jgi:hypothetical protein
MKIALVGAEESFNCFPQQAKDLMPIPITHTSEANEEAINVEQFRD